MSIHHSYVRMHMHWWFCVSWDDLRGGSATDWINNMQMDWHVWSCIMYRRKPIYVFNAGLLNSSFYTLVYVLRPDWHRDLRYSGFCVSQITAKIWLDMTLYDDICEINNVSLFLWKVKLLLSTQLTSWQLCDHAWYTCLSFQFWLKLTRMSQKTCITWPIYSYYSPFDTSILLEHSIMIRIICNLCIDILPYQ